MAESLRESCGDLDALLAKLKAQLEPMYKEDLHRQVGQGGLQPERSPRRCGCGRAYQAQYI